MSSLSANKNNTTALYGIIGLVGTLSLTACQQTPDYNNLSGETMGTSYHISYQLPHGADAPEIQQEQHKKMQDKKKSKYNKK